MCLREPAQCPELRAPRAGLRQAAVPAPDQGVILVPARWEQLNRVNLAINMRVRYVPDEQRIGTIDYWTPAASEGDCKDYALAKRQTLWAAGWPAATLRIAVVHSPRTGPHAVLLANTDRGAYVLDNTMPWILPWEETDYTWIAAQDAAGDWRVAGRNAEAVRMVALITMPNDGRPARPQIAAASGLQIPDTAALKPSGR